MTNAPLQGSTAPAGNGRDPSATSDAILRIDGLSMRFGGLNALNNVSMAVPRGEIRAIIGPNGAGKSTFFNSVTGVLMPTGGRILFDGEEITGLPPHRISKKGIARSYQDVIERARAVLASVGLAEKEDELAANLSHGEQRHLEIGIALGTEPKLLCLDEPTAGMSVTETHATVELIRRIATNLTIMIVEHDMEVVMGLAHVITVLHYGEVLAEGTPAAIQANPRVQEVYLKT